MSDVLFACILIKFIISKLNLAKFPALQLMSKENAIFYINII